MIGTSLTHYRITAKLGQGGMGAVYALAVSGDRAKAGQILRDLENLAKQRYVSPSATMVVYLGLALEPHVRRLWPQVLISWSRLVNGQWRDPLVGQNMLLGVLAGVVAAAVIQLQVLAPAWFGLTPQPFMPSHMLTLDGPFALVGLLLRQIINQPGQSLLTLMILFLCGRVLRQALLASCGYVAVMTIVFTAFHEAHPVLGWFAVGIGVALCLWFYLRRGLLAGIDFNLTFDTLLDAPLTTNFSAWYAGNELAVAAFFLALAPFGFYTSQDGRPIFADSPGGRRSNRAIE